MNTIGKITFDFQAENQSFVQALYGTWESLFSDTIERIADEVLGRNDRKEERLTIDSIRIDLGPINENDFYEKFPRLFRQKLEEEMSRIRHSPASYKSPVKRISIKKEAFVLLTEFLLHGRIDPSQLSRYGDLNALFIHVIQHSGKELAGFLRNYGHYTSLQRRITYQFNDEALEEGVRLFLPAESTFIGSYVRFLKKRYRKIERPAVTATEYRYAVWQVVYSYLLGNRSSYFNRKSFIIRTLVSLSARLNVTFEYLAGLLTDELPDALEEASAPPELFVILKEINRENLSAEIRRSAFRPAEFYRILCTSLKKGLKSGSDPEIVQALTFILSHRDSRQTLLSLMKEEEIVRLVPLVAERESHFIIGYARELEHYKDKGTFEGRAGSEFSKLKWMVIFPVLLENRGSVFNRKSFVRSVLAEVSAHYNFTLAEVVDFLLSGSCLPLIDPVLAGIFKDISRDISAERRAAAPSPGTGTPESPEVLAQELLRGEPLNRQQQAALLNILSDNARRKEFLKELREEGIKKALAELFPGEREFVTVYAENLKRAGQYDALSGRTGGDFPVLIWSFVFGVLTEESGNRFNRRTFARRMLQKLASHYNLYYAELLAFFHSEVRESRLPAEWTEIITGLYEEEQTRWVRDALRTPGEPPKKKILQTLFPEDTGFILEFFRRLEWFFRTGIQKLAGDPAYAGLVKQGERFSGFGQYKWEILFEWIFSLRFDASPGGKGIHKKTFVREMLERIGKHYRIDPALFGYGFRAALERQPDHTPAWIWTAWPDEFSAPPEKTTRPPSGDPATEAGTATDTVQEAKRTLKNKETENETPDMPDLHPPFGEPVFVYNAGIVLLSPYLPRLFTLLEWLDENRKFKNRESQTAAMYTIQYLVSGTTESPEPEMLLNKLLTGYSLSEPVPGSYTLTDKQTEAADSLLQGVLMNWEKLKNTSVPAFREAFLQRGGKLEENEEVYSLTVEEKAYDLLIDSVPWGYKQIRYPWMGKLMIVNWR